MLLFPITRRPKLSALLFAAWVAVATVNADTLTVTATTDAGPGSLREAIAAANNGDIIQFDTTLNGQAITLTSAELAINKDIRIRGPWPSALTVERSAAGGTPNFRIFHILPGRTVTIEGLTIRYGQTTGSGGGIWNQSATLTIDRCVVYACSSAFSYGGGILNDGSGSGSSATLTILNSTINGSYADSAGGGIYNGGNASLTILNTAVTENRAAHARPPLDFDGYGGGICNSDRLTIIKSIVSNNVAGDNAFGNFPNGNGGGIYNTGVATIVDSTVSGNRVALAAAGSATTGR